MPDEKINESVARSMERLEKILERLEKRLDTLETPVREGGREERERERAERRAEREAEREAERAERRAEQEAERAEREAERAEREAERAEEEAERAEEAEPAEAPPRAPFPFGPGEDFEKHMEQMGENIGRQMEHLGEQLGRQMERQFGPGRPSKTQEFKLSDFSSIEVRGAFEIEIERADSYSVSVTADEELFNNLKVEKEHDKLEIRHARHIGWFSSLTRPKARITLPILKGLEMSGASRATIKGFSSTEDFHLELSGASRVSGDITTGNAEFELSGASRADLTGSAKDIVIEASGANHLDLGNFSAHNVAVKLSGAAKCAVKVEGRLDARLSGASQLGYTGNAMMGDIRTSGASRLSRR